MIQVLVKRHCVLLTTSRRPTERMRTLCRDISHSFPNIVQINRGKLSIEGIIEKALEFNAEKVMVVDRWEGGLGKIEFFDAEHGSLDGVPPTIYVGNAKFRRDFGEQIVKRRIKSVAIETSLKENFEVEKLENFLSGFFDVPAISFEEVVDGKYDAVMQILKDSSNRVTITFRLIPEMVEVGPRIWISHLVWELAR